MITWDNPANFVSHSLWLEACQEIGETFFYPTNEAGDVISVADLGSNNKKKKKKKIQSRVKNGWGRLKYPLKTEDYLKPNKVCKALYDSWIACGWKNIPKNTSQTVNRMLERFMNKRELRSFSRVKKFYKNDLEITDEKHDDDMVYFLDQKLFVKFYFNKFSGSESEVHRNDIIRLFHCVLQDKNKDALVCYLGLKTKEADDFENPMMKKEYLFSEVAIDFCFLDLIFRTPDRKQKIMGHEDLDPNDRSRMEIPRTGEWAQDLFAKELVGYILTKVRFVY